MNFMNQPFVWLEVQSGLLKEKGRKNGEGRLPAVMVQHRNQPLSLIGKAIMNVMTQKVSQIVNAVPIVLQVMEPKAGVVSAIPKGAQIIVPVTVIPAVSVELDLCAAGLPGTCLLCRKRETALSDEQFQKLVIELDVAADALLNP